MTLDVASTITALSALMAFYMAWTMGGNDLANAMGMVVSSGSLSIRNAIALGMAFAFVGAVVLSGNVTHTLELGITDPAVSRTSARTFAIGMAACLLSACLWLRLASSRDWPVSTTQSIVGAILGFGLASGGFSGIHWRMVGSIGAAWILSPIAAAVVAHLLFRFVQFAVLDARTPLRRLRVFGPMVIAPIFAVIAGAVWLRQKPALASYDGRSTLHWMLYAAGAAALASLPFFVWLTREESPTDHRENLRRTERVFAGLQVLTACLVAFAHGSNDVANAVGPLNAVFRGFSSEKTLSIAEPTALVMLGAIGIGVGLSTYGYRIIRVVRSAVTELKPTRGFTAELATGAVVCSASVVGLPVSTTQTLVGAILGVGLARSIAALDLRVIRSVILGWITTLPATAALSAVTFWILRACLAV